MTASSTLLHDLLTPSTMPGMLFSGSLCFLVALALTLIIRRISARVRAHLSDVTALDFIAAFAQTLTWLFAFIAFAHVVPELRALASALLAGVSVLSLAVGIAAQNTLGNLIAGLSLVLSRVVHVGDQVIIASPVGSMTGTVKLISLATTTLVDNTGREVIVPNSLVMGSAVTHVAKTIQGSPR